MSGLVVTVPQAEAETVTMMSGKVLTGEIVERGEDSLKLKVPSGNIVSLRYRLINPDDVERFKFFAKGVDLNAISVPDFVEGGPVSDAARILRKVRETYRGLASYSAHIRLMVGADETMSEGPEASLTVEADMLLGRPGYYRIALTAPMDNKDSRRWRAVIWNAGSGSFHYAEDVHTVATVWDDGVNLGIGARPAMFDKLEDIPRLFFPGLNKRSFLYADLKSWVVAGTDVIGRENCTVLKGRIDDVDYQIWVSDRTYFILKMVTRRPPVPRENIPMDALLEMKDNPKMQEVIAALTQGGSMVTQIHKIIATDFNVDENQFEFEVPRGTSSDDYEGLIRKRSGRVFAVPPRPLDGSGQGTFRQGL